MSESENINIAYEFINWNEDFRKDLEHTFPDEDILETSAFSGKEVLALIGSTSDWFVEKLSELLKAWKTKPEGQRIRLKIGENEVELSGFESDEIEEVKAQIQALIADLRKE